MKTKMIDKMLALLLALVMMLSFAGFAEELDTDDSVMVIETTLAESTISEQGDVLLLVEEDEYSVEILTGEEESAPEVFAAEGPEETLVSQQDDEQPASDESKEEPQGPAPELEKTTLKLGVKEKYNLELKDGVSPESVGAVFTSSKTSVVKVNKTTGRLVARKKGTAIITMTTADGSVSTCKVSVLKAPTKVSISSKKMTLGVGEEATLKASVHKTSASAFLFSSNKPEVVSVEANGHIVALKKGTAKITVKTFNGKKASCTVTVKAAPKSVSFSKSEVSIWKGDTLTVAPKLSKDSAGGYTITSDNESVVSVSGTKLKGVNLGTANITVTTYNGKTASLWVEVRHKPVYRALLVGECTFPGTMYSDLPAKKDVSLMKKMLSKTKGATKTKWSVTDVYDRTTEQINKDILSAFSGAQEGDVSLFYISTHGDEVVSFDSNTPEYAGYLITYPDTRYDNMYEKYTMTLVCLASWLKDVPGQVVVIIDSCGSGAAIYGVKGNSAKAAEFSPGDFDENVIEAFEGQDKAVMAPGVDEGAFVIQNKFFVLTSAAYQETCWTNDGKYSYFTKWLTDGISTKGSMPADTNKNKVTTLNELYKYIKKRSDKTVIEPKKGSKYKQHVQVYPSGSSFALFYRK